MSSNGPFEGLSFVQVYMMFAAFLLVHLTIFAPRIVAFMSTKEVIQDKPVKNFDVIQGKMRTAMHVVNFLVGGILYYAVLGYYYASINSDMLLDWSIMPRNVFDVLMIPIWFFGS